MRMGRCPIARMSSSLTDEPVNEIFSGAKPLASASLTSFGEQQSMPHMPVARMVASSGANRLDFTAK